MNALLPCPFCGCKDVDLDFYRETTTGSRILECRESTCHAFMYRARIRLDDSDELEPQETTDAALIARWNRRTPEQS